MTSSGIGLLQWVANAVGPGSVAACGLFISSCYCFHPEAFRPVTAPRSGDPWSRRAPFHPVYSWYYDILVQGIAGGLGQEGPAQCLLQQAMCGGISRPRCGVWNGRITRFTQLISTSGKDKRPQRVVLCLLKSFPQMNNKVCVCVCSIFRYPLQSFNEFISNPDPD